MSKIQWTEQTWNPIAGCSIVSTECKNCYAMRMASRLAAMGLEKYQGLTESKGFRPVWNGTIHLDDAALQIPLKRKKPTMYFVNSMSDLFHEGVTFSFIDDMYAVMLQCPEHTFQILTKRSETQRDYLNDPCTFTRIVKKLPPTATVNDNWPLPNVWQGVSVGYRLAKHRIDELRQTNTAIRFLSCEPLLEDLGELNLSGIDWVIIGGESGPGARPFDIRWAVNITVQCLQQNVAVFVKQLGSRPVDSLYQFGVFAPEDARSIRAAKDLKLEHIGFNLLLLKDSKGGDMSEWPLGLQIREFPKSITERSAEAGGDTARGREPQGVVPGSAKV